MTTELPTTLYTAIGRFEGIATPRWIIEVAVPNFPSDEEAKVYAEAFRIKLVDGLLYRDTGQGIGVFDETWREVLDSQVTLSREEASGQKSEPVDLAIAQWHLEPGLTGDFKSAGWRTAAESI